MFNVAICDDDKNFIQYVEDIIKELGYAEDVKFFEYLSGEEFLFDIDERGDLDLVVLDIQMGETDGNQVSVELRKGGQVGAQAQGKLILQIALHPVVIAQQLAAGLLHAPNGLLYHALVGYHTHSFSVQRHRIAGGVQRCQGQRHRQGRGADQKGHRARSPIARYHIMDPVGCTSPMDPAPLLKRFPIDGRLPPEVLPSLPQRLPLRAAGLFRI